VLLGRVVVCRERNATAPEHIEHNRPIALGIGTALGNPLGHMGIVLGFAHASRTHGEALVAG
jgi:hypothetical protein